MANSPVVDDAGQAPEIAQYKGFSVRVFNQGPGEGYKLLIVNPATGFTHTTTTIPYSELTAAGAVQRIDNKVSSIPKAVEQAKNKLEQAKKNLKTYNEQAAAPFDYQERLDKTTEQLAILERKLQGQELSPEALATVEDIITGLPEPEPEPIPSYRWGAAQEEQKVEEVKQVLDIGGGENIAPEATHVIDEDKPKVWYHGPDEGKPFKPPEHVEKYYEGDYREPPKGTEDKFDKVVANFVPGIDLAETKTEQKEVGKAIDHYVKDGGDVEIATGDAERKDNVEAALKLTDFTKVKSKRVKGGDYVTTAEAPVYGEPPKESKEVITPTQIEAKAAPVAPSDKAKKARVKVVEAPKTTEAKPGVSIISLANDTRSPHAIRIDQALRAKTVLPRKQADRWREAPNRTDLAGYDTPKRQPRGPGILTKSGRLVKQKKGTVV